ncbi:hypothetical protein LCGC14_1789480 [marine sediment metagenome]|uniref:Glycosyl-hydrolase family 116 N-terminal domain-containing protein n=1 Tax=marine sediment metagenome TaxID=412755 RepID=A0A0F9GT08_9ZZZZ
MAAMAGRRGDDAGGIPYRRADLYDQAVPGYTGAALKMISFPLGGIGTGTIGLGGRGNLRDWEIFNGPKLGYVPPYTMPFIFARCGKRTVAKVLERQLPPDHHESHGMRPQHFPGLPRLDKALFVGTYPVARVEKRFQTCENCVEEGLTRTTTHDRHNIIPKPHRPQDYLLNWTQFNSQKVEGRDFGILSVEL